MVFNRFFKDRRGAFAVQFALMAPVFMLAVGSAVEYSRAYNARAAVRNALDTATLSATRLLALEPGSTNADIVSLVQRQLSATELGRSAGLTCDAPAVSIDRVNVSVSTSVSCTMDTMLPVALDHFRLERSAASEMNFDSLDVAFMLDVSGSMRGSKLRNLKDAVKDAFDIFLANSRSEVRIALAPYSTSVDAGDYAEPATGEDLWVQRDWWGNYYRSVPGVGTRVDCVTERRGGEAFTDAPPSTEYLRRRSADCNPARILPLTNNLSTLRNAVNNYDADGATAGHLGIAWSWYLISSEWRSFWPASSRPLATGDGRKAVIIMTDGEFNTQYENSNGNSAYQSQQLCSRMKSAGVLVFSVGFQAPNSVKSTLRNCATTPDYFFDSGSRDELKEAYRAIAEELSTHVLIQ